ncbi:hypothetical protein FEI14_06650 [Lacticaseibacillus zeae]|uniref:Uncharacterized protein n=1 Tax=Lacticaseibacillus zeae TaxID=57037 RepID=A0A5R8LYY8_LACZE|nr:hypothetical protein FEI14_06650 [Lacticaseibacillus zeae]
MGVMAVFAIATKVLTRRLLRRGARYGVRHVLNSLGRDGLGFGHSDQGHLHADFCDCKRVIET